MASAFPDNRTPVFEPMRWACSQKWNRKMPSGARIAVIDDDAPALQATVSLIAAMGFEARGFESAYAFLASGLLATTDCLVSDIRMPGMSGVELYRRLLASDNAIPTILTTAYPDEPTRALAMAAGIDGYFAKPFDPEDLMACLRKALRAS